MGTTTPSSKEFTQVLQIIAAAVAARISLVQIREKNLNPTVLSDLALRAAQLTRGTGTRLLINHAADVAVAANADGVHLTTHSVAPGIIRERFGGEFLIGVSTHSLAEARQACAGGADFVVFGPVFETASKQIYGAPHGLARLAEVASDLAPFPVLALGGVNIGNARECLKAGAAGIAGISLFSKASGLPNIVRLVI